MSNGCAKLIRTIAQVESLIIGETYKKSYGKRHLKFTNDEILYGYITFCYLELKHGGVVVGVSVAEDEEAHCEIEQKINARDIAINGLRNLSDEELSNLKRLDDEKNNSEFKKTILTEYQFKKYFTSNIGE